MKIGFIGGGMMGEALMKGIIAQGKAAAADIYVSEKSAQRVEYLKNELKVNAEMGPVGSSCLISPFCFIFSFWMW